MSADFHRPIVSTRRATSRLPAFGPPAVGAQDAGDAPSEWSVSRLVKCGTNASCKTLLLAAFLVITHAAWLRGADEVAISHIQVGFDGFVKAGRWAPIRFQIDGPIGTTVESRVLASDPDGDTVAWPLSTVTIGPTGSEVVQGVFQIGRVRRGIRIVAGEAVAFVPPKDQAPGDSFVQADRQATRYVAVAGECTAFVTSVNGADDVEPLMTDARLVDFSAPDAIPDAALALDALDVLILAPATILSERQSRVVEEWVLSGGHLVIGLNDQVDEFAATPLARWLPVEVLEPVALTDLLPISDAVPRSPPLRYRGGVPGARIRAMSAQTLIGSLGGPLALRAPFGFGRVTVFGVDWRQSAVAEWPGMIPLAVELMDVTTVDDQNRAAGGAQLRPTGVSDLATQLTGQLDQFTAFERPSYWTVLGYIMLFLLLVGPIDYWLVSKLLNRPQLTWATLPTWVALASLGAMLITASSNADRQLVNQFDLVDIDADAGFARVRSFMTVYSPQPRRYSLRSHAPEWIFADAEDPAPRLSWSGVPETGFRGMYRSSGLDLAGREYRLAAANDTLPNVPIDTNSSKAFTVFAAARVSTVAELIEADLQADSRGRLTADSTLTHRLPAPLTDWCLMYRSVAYIPRRSRTVDVTPGIPAGVPWKPEENSALRVIDRFLKNVSYDLVPDRQNRRGQDAVPNREEYDPLGISAVGFARTLTFHEAAGGEEYTTLENEPLRSYDLSSLLKLDRAVLFGRVDSPATSYHLDEELVQPRHTTTFIRIVLPVRPADDDAGLSSVP